jgi:hypothetical protein
LPPVPQGNKTRRSGQTTCYQNRTPSFAIDTSTFGAKAMPRRAARSLAPAFNFSYGLFELHFREIDPWRLLADVCAERCGTRSRRKRRSARAIAGAACANISAAEQARSAPSSARRTSMFPVRSPTTCAKLTVGRPCTGVFAPDAGPMCSANPKSGRHLSLCALERLTIRIWGARSDHLDQIRAGMGMLRPRSA